MVFRDRLTSFVFRSMSRIQITLGRNSSNERIRESLEPMPHLFISYSNADQWIAWTALLDIPDHAIVYSLGESAAQADSIRMFGLVSEATYDPVPGARDFFKELMKELGRRLKRSGKAELPVLVLMSDVMKLFGPGEGRQAQSFLKLLLAGPSVNMHVIAGSNFSYHTLMKQLLTLQIKMNSQLQFFLQQYRLQAVPPLGWELIINPERLIYVRRPGFPVYNHYFWI